MKTTEQTSKDQLPESPRGWKIWLMAARPKTLPAAAAPVLVGSALAWRDGVFSPGLAGVALLAALLLQIGANLANDVFDFYRGADRGERLGPTRVTQAGMLTPRQVLWGMWLVFGLAALLGVVLIAAAGWPVVWIGLASILAAIAYTGGPFPLGYYGLGDLAVFVFFGLAGVCGTYFVQAQSVSAGAVWASLPIGLLTVNILVVNNLRDIENDRRVGKHTLAVRFGAAGARGEYILCLLGAYAALPAMILAGEASPWVLAALASLPFALRIVREVYTLQGRALNHTLAATGQFELWFALLFAIGLAI